MKPFCGAYTSWIHEVLHHASGDEVLLSEQVTLLWVKTITTDHPSCFLPPDLVWVDSIDLAELVDAPL